jgi:L,D-peptidoglycan transpeptidase YkuD (ErfK/YbiS/YcfS/YnhG family)
MARRHHNTVRKTSVRKTSLSAIHVHVRPRLRAQAWLVAGQIAIPAAVGRASVKPAKREGDGATPAGHFHPVRLWWRADRLPRPRTRLPVRPIAPDHAWCEDPNDRRYNRPFRRSANEPGDRLARADGLYDLIVEIDHNTRPRVAGRGSAVFIHVARPGFGPTAGCIALRCSDLQRLVSRLSRKTRIIVHS